MNSVRHWKNLIWDVPNYLYEYYKYYFRLILSAYTWGSNELLKTTLLLKTDFVFIIKAVPLGTEQLPREGKILNIIDEAIHGAVNIVGTVFNSALNVGAAAVDTAVGVGTAVVDTAVGVTGVAVGTAAGVAGVAAGTALGAADAVVDTVDVVAHEVHGAVHGR